MRSTWTPRVAATLLSLLPVVVGLEGCAVENGGEESSSVEGEMGEAPPAGPVPSAIIDTPGGCAHQYADWFRGTASVGHACESRRVNAKYFATDLFKWPSGDLALDVPTTSIWNETSQASRAALLGIVLDRAEHGDKEAESLVKLFFSDFKRFMTDGWQQAKGPAHDAVMNLVLSSMRDKMKLGSLNDRYRDLTLADLPLGTLFDVFGGQPPGVDLRKVAEELFGSPSKNWTDAKLIEEIRKLNIPVEGGSIVGKQLDKLSAQARSLLDPNVWLRKGYDTLLNTVSDYLASRIRVHELVDVIAGSVIRTTIKEAGAYVLGTMKAGSTAFSSAFFSALYANVFFAVAVHFVVEPIVGQLIDFISYLFAGELEERQCSQNEAASVRDWFLGKPGSAGAKAEETKLKNLTTVARYTCMAGTKSAVANKIESANVQVEGLSCVAKENARQTVYGSEFGVRCETCYRTRPETCRTLRIPLDAADVREVRKVAPAAYASYVKQLKEKYLSRNAFESEAVESVSPLKTAYGARVFYEKMEVTLCSKLDPATTCSDLVMAKHDAYVAKCAKNPLDPSCSGCGRLAAPQRPLAEWEVWTRQPRMMTERAVTLNNAGDGDLRTQGAASCGGTSKVQYNPVTERSYCCPVDLGESRVLAPKERDSQCGHITSSVICEKSGVCTFRAGRCIARTGAAKDDPNAASSGTSASSTEGRATN